MCAFLTVLMAAAGFAAPPVLKKPAPPFTLADLDNKPRSLADYRGRPVALYVFCGCNWCQETAQHWAEVQHGGVLDDTEGSGRPADRPVDSRKKPITLIVFMGDKEAAQKFAVAHALDMSQTVMLPDPRSKVVLDYEALPCPRAYVLDRNGVVRYMNNHKDDAPQKAPAAAIISRVVDTMRTVTAEPASAVRPATPGGQKKKGKDRAKK